MSKFKSIFNKFIIILIITVTLVCFIMPSYSHATVKSVLADGFQTIIFYLCDGLVTIGEKVFTGSTLTPTDEQDSALEDKDNKFNIKYGVGTIVSGKLSFYDINFFNPKPSYDIVNETDSDTKAFLNIYKKVESTLSGELDYIQKNYNQWGKDIGLDRGADNDPNLMSDPNMSDTEKNLVLEQQHPNFYDKWTAIYSTSRYIDTGSATNNANGQTRSFSNLFESVFFDKIQTIWKEMYNEDYLDSEFRKVFINYIGDTDSNGNTAVTFYTKYATDTEFKADELKALFKKLEPVVQKIYDDSCEVTTIDSTAKILSPTVGRYYAALRTIALVSLLSILVYIGIKIIISSTAGEKAKYKHKLVNVLVALCLLFVMQYIMVTLFYVTDILNNAISTEVVDKNGNDILMTTVRNKADITKSTKAVLIYTIIYAALVFLTAIFTIMYIKRMLSIMLLTLISPMVTVTYPIDKENDGKAQAFSFWLREYIFNIIIQPIHLILYVVFIQSTITLVENGNFFWALAVMMFMMRAEKIVRNMFGINSNTLPDSKSGIAGMALAATAARKVAGGIKSMTSKGNNKALNKAHSEGNDTKIRQKSIEDYNDIDNTDDTKQQEIRKDGKDNNENDNNDTEINNNQTNEKNNKGEKNNKLEENNSRNEINERSVNSNSNVVGNNKVPRKNVIKGIRRVGRKVFTAKNIGKVAKTAGRVALGATGGAIGLSAAIASGDAKNIGNFVATGIGAGIGATELAAGAVNGIGNIGKNIKNGAIDISDTYRIGANNWTQKEYEENVVIPRMKKNNAKNKEIQDKYERELGSKDYLESSERDALYDAGIVDEDQIIKAINQKEKDNISQNEMVQNALIASKIKDRKDYEAMEKQLRKILTKQGLQEKELNKAVDQRMKRISELSGIY